MFLSKVGCPTGRVGNGKRKRQKTAWWDTRHSAAASMVPPIDCPDEEHSRRAVNPISPFIYQPGFSMTYPCMWYSQVRSSRLHTPDIRGRRRD